MGEDLRKRRDLISLEAAPGKEREGEPGRVAIERADSVCRDPRHRTGCIDCPPVVPVKGEDRLQGIQPVSCHDPEIVPGS
jgi:hypothetical protein